MKKRSIKITFDEEDLSGYFEIYLGKKPIPNFVLIHLFAKAIDYFAYDGYKKEKERFKDENNAN